MYNFLLLRFLVRFVLYFCLFGCLEPLSVSDKKKKKLPLRHWIFFHAMSPVCKQFKYMALSGKDRCMRFLCQQFVTQVLLGIPLIFLLAKSSPAGK